MRSRHPLVHRSPVLLLVCLLCLSTSLALFRVATTLTSAENGPRMPTNAAALAVVDRFYAAANAVLRTGDTTDLAAVLSPDFVDHEPAPGSAPDRNGLARVLVARHATFPDERIVVDHAVAAEDEVTVRVHAEDTAAGAFLGLPLPAAAGAWGPLEVFRVEGDAIAERWGGPPELFLAEPLWQTPSPAIGDGTARAVVSLERRTYAPGDERVLGDDGVARIVFVESGTLTGAGETTSMAGGGHPVPRPVLLAGRGTVVAGTPPALPDSRRPIALTPGDLVAIPPAGRLATRNDGAATAVAVAVGVAVPDRLASGMLAPEGVAAGAVVPPGAMLVAGRHVLAAGRLALAPGATLAFPASAGPLLVVVEAGQLTVATPDGAGGKPTWQSVATGDGTTAQVVDGGTWQAGPGEPTILLVVTMTAGDGAAGTTPAMGTAPTGNQ
jgi:predicted ester cyclase